VFKFIHAADIHLDSPLHRLAEYDGAPVSEIRQSSRRAFENLVDLAIDESVDFVLIAGDLFDGNWKDFNTGLYFVSQVRRLKAAGIPVWVISGNHDAVGQMTRSLPFPDNVHLFDHKKPETRRLESLKVAVHGQSFATAVVMDNLALNYPQPVAGWYNIGLLHTSLTGRDGHETYAPCTPDDLKTRGYDYWALGHAHRYEMVCEDPAIVYSGCIQGRHIRETGAKGCVLATVEEGRPLEVSFIRIGVIAWEQVAVDLCGVDDEPGCLDRFKAALECQAASHVPLPVIARVVFSGSTRAHEQIAGNPQRWVEMVRSAAIDALGERVWIEKVAVNTKPGPRIKPIDHGPLLELEQLVAEIGASPAQLLELGEELADLLRKLPAECRQGEDPIAANGPERMGRILEQAHAVLVRWLEKGGPDDEAD